ncbi:MAG: sigma-70 family RNA polymerase sigma factor [Tannerella sp.]|jgi:RNA polymerase sigma factor (sigma-70 family)|nr:sigma-70 family RNA polymerase sigma factor [Tannerella sp.]
MKKRMEEKTNKTIDTVYRTYVHDLFSYALNLGFDREIAMDAIHDVFYTLCLDKDLLNHVIHIRFYLLRSLKNRLLNLHKQKKEVTELPPEGSATEQEIPFSIHVTVEDLMIEAEEEEKIRQKVDQLLQNLTNRQREIIYLRYTMDCDYKEIAQLMHITVPACRKLMHITLAKLKRNAVSAN